MSYKSIDKYKDIKRKCQFSNQFNLEIIPNFNPFSEI